MYMYIRYLRKTKTIFTENILATGFINSLLSKSHFSLIIHLQVTIYIIYMNETDNATTNFLQRSYFIAFINYLKPSDGI